MIELSAKITVFFRSVAYALGIASLLMSCGIKSSVEITKVGAGVAGVTISKIRPIEAKPSDVVTIEGSNFSAAKNLRARFTLSDGSTTDLPLNITDRSKASFVMPEGVGLGLKSLTIVQGASKEVATLGLVSNTAENQLPIWIGDASDICSTRQYIDRNGDQQTGTKDCAASSTAACTSDGASNCVVDGSTYKAAAIANISASNIKSGITIAGVTGNVTVESHSNCAADGATGCVAVATYPAALATGAASKILSGQTLAGVAGNITLPAVGKVYTGITYGVSGTGSTGTLTIPAAANVLSTAPAYGDPGAQLTPSLAAQGTWNLASSFPGAGYYAAVSNSPTAATIATGTTITGVAGSGTLAPANCAADGATGCVAVATYPAALATGAASKILSGQTLAGVAGNITLPAVGKVYTGITYGVSGTGNTGTLTIPAAANVLSTAPAYGDPGAQLTPSLTSQGTWNLSMGFPGAGYYAAVSNSPTAATIATGTTITGVAGTATLAPANCSANGQQSCVATGSYYAGTACTSNSSACYLPSYVATTQPLKAISYDTINSSVASIRSGTTLGGVAGTLADCSSNGVTGCVTTASYKSADLTNLSVGNVKNGVTIAGTAGQYPNSTYPLTGSSGTDLTSATFNAQVKSAATFQYFGSDGTRYTATGDSDISATNISSGVDIFGTTGTLSGGATPPDPWNVRVGVTVNGVTGKLKVNCRNRVRSAVFNYDNPGTFAIGKGAVTSGTAIDIWDTVDDYSNSVSGLPPSIVTAWTSDTDCGGVEATAADANVWKDVTTAGSGAASCSGSPENCTMQDKITGLWWSKIQTGSTWDVAWSTCLSLNHNGQSGWRLSTQKELMDGYNHGIRSAASANWIDEGTMYNRFWSGSSVSRDTINAWDVNLANGTTNVNDKYDSYQVVCVRRA